MDIDRKTILAFILIGLIFLLTNTSLYKKTFFPETYKKERLQKQMQAIKNEAIKDTVSVPNKQPLAVTKKEKENVLKLGEKAKAIVVEKESNNPGRLFTIDTDLYTAIFSSKGGTLVQIYLKKYQGPDGKKVKLFQKDTYGNLGISFTDTEGDTVNTEAWQFQSHDDTVIVLSGNQTEAHLKFQKDLSEYKKIIKEFIFYPHTYHFDMKIALLNMGDVIGDKYYSINAPTGMASTEKRLKDDMQYTKAIISAGGEILKKGKIKNQKYKESGDINWVALRTKYFTLSIVPEKKSGIYAEITGQEIPVDPQHKLRLKKFAVSMTMPFIDNNSQKDQFMIYVGPLDYDVLKKYNLGLEKMMDFGFFLIQPFSKAILWSFKKLHRVIPNYGWVLILFAIFIKLIVYPLTHKSYQSMRKMQEIQPKLNELKEKYGKDPQRLNKETMKLYKEEGVNPMGGCLPMLLQMPLLWGLFIVFRTTIELRGASFIWWIKDLSMPDTVARLPFMIPIYGDSVNVLPLFMGVTMLLQQKMSTTDPKQKAMVYFMPIFLTLLFNQFPSGLNLYYALFNILSIIQQKWLVPMHDQRKKEVGVMRKN